MIEPNFDLFLWILLMLYGFIGVANIVSGAMRYSKPKNYGTLDVLSGLLMLLICFVVCIY